jgi:hypothetical protein
MEGASRKFLFLGHHSERMYTYRINAVQKGAPGGTTHSGIPTGINSNHPEDLFEQQRSQVELLPQDFSRKIATLQ